jgi:hypothetical protein
MIRSFFNSNVVDTVGIWSPSPRRFIAPETSTSSSLMIAQTANRSVGSGLIGEVMKDVCASEGGLCWSSIGPLSNRKRKVPFFFRS